MKEYEAYIPVRQRPQHWSRYGEDRLTWKEIIGVILFTLFGMVNV